MSTIVEVLNSQKNKVPAEPAIVVDAVVRTRTSTLIKTKNADFLILLYQDHKTSLDPGIIPSNASALFLECSNWMSVTNPFEAFKSDPQYGNLLCRSKELKIPVYLGDVEIHSSLHTKEVAGVVAECLVGLGLLAATGTYAVKTANHENRRGAIKKLLTVCALGGASSAYLSAPLLGYFLRNELPNEATARFDRAVSKIHPEIMKKSIHMRNAVMAFKQRTIADELSDKSEQKPLIVSAVGATHASLEDYLVMPQVEIFKLLAKWRPSLTKQITTPETFYTLRKSEYGGTKADSIVSDLRNIWDGVSNQEKNTD